MVVPIWIMSPGFSATAETRWPLTERAVGRAEVGQHDLAAVEVEPGVPAGDADVGQAQVGLVAAADHGRADGERIGAAVVGDQPGVAGRRRPASAGRRAGSRLLLRRTAA